MSKNLMLCLVVVRALGAAIVVSYAIALSCTIELICFVDFLHVHRI